MRVRLPITACLAASLAARGFTARENTLDIAQGFGDSMAEGVRNIDRALERIGELFHTQDTLFKYHPACYGVHAPTEAALALRLQDGFDPALVEKIEISVPQNAIGMCDIAEPKTGLEAKFSLAHNVAPRSAGQGRRLTGAVPGRDVRGGRRGRSAQEGGRAWQAGVRLVLLPKLVVTQKDGKVIKQDFDIGKPMADLSEQEAKLEKKFRALATPLIGAEHRPRAWSPPLPASKARRLSATC